MERWRYQSLPIGEAMWTGPPRGDESTDFVVAGAGAGFSIAPMSASLHGMRNRIGLTVARARRAGMLLRVTLGSLLAVVVLVGVAVPSAVAAQGRDDDNGRGRPESDDRGPGNGNGNGNGGPGNGNGPGRAPDPPPTAPPPVSVAPRPVPAPTPPPVTPAPPVVPAAPVAPPRPERSRGHPGADGGTAGHARCGPGGSQRQLGHAEAPAAGASPTTGVTSSGGPQQAPEPRPAMPRRSAPAATETAEPAPSTPANVSNSAASTAGVSNDPLIAPIVPAAAGLPFEPFPLGSSSPTNGPSPFVPVFLAVGSVALILFLFGPRGRGFVGYWASEARLAFLARRRSGD